MIFCHHYCSDYFHLIALCVTMPDGGGEYSIYELGDFRLASDEVLPSAFLAYKTFGDPSSPALIYPTWYGGSMSGTPQQTPPLPSPLPPSSLSRLPDLSLVASPSTTY